jgi:uncharacterized tellurite resistance protein B-like protein
VQTSAQRYEPNSPQAIARVLAMLILSDGHVDRRELKALERTMAYSRLGMAKSTFTQVAQDYSAELAAATADADDYLVKPRDNTRIDSALQVITDPMCRKLLAGVCAAIIFADEDVHPGEEHIYARMAQLWHLPPKAHMMLQ